MRDTIEFQHGFELLAPQYLWLLAIVFIVFMAGKYFAMQRAKARQMLGFRFTADLFLSFVAPATIVCLLMIALLRPSTGTTIRNVSRESHTLFIALDLSRSMLAEDVPPSRLIQARRGITDLLNGLEQLPHDVRVSIILFSGTAVTFCPLTSDFQILRMYAREISPALFSSRGTSLSALRDLLVEKDEQLSLPSFTVALFSDGGFSDDMEFERGPLLREEVAMFTYGVGRTKGAPIPLESGELQKDGSGNIVITRLNASSLKEIAEAHKARYVELATVMKPFAPLLSHIESQLKDNATALEQKYAQKNEVFHYPLWAIIFLVAVLSLIPLRAGILIAVFCLASLIHVRPLQADTSSLQHGKHAYFDEDYEEALNHLRSATRDDNNNPEAQFALGATLFRLKKFQEAGQIFRSLAADSKEGRKVVEALYNAGNSDLADKRPSDAIEVYEQALSLFPEHAPTLHNLEIAKALKEQQAQNPQPQNQQSPESSEQDTQNSQSAQSNQESRKSESDSDASEESSQKDEAQESGNESDQSAGEERSQEGDKEEDARSDQDGVLDENISESTRDNSNESLRSDGVELLTEQEAGEEAIQGARVWVDSLPQSPIILPAYSDNVKRGGQEW